MAAAGDQQVGTPEQEYLKKEQKELLEYVRERAALRDEEAAKRKAGPQPRKPLTLQARESAGALQLSPDGKYVIASVFESAANAKSNAVPNYISDSGYTEEIPGRTNVGDVQGRSRLAILNVETGAVTWVDHGQKSGSQPRDVQLSEPVWSEDGTKAAFAGRSADNKDRWLFALDPATGSPRVLDSWSTTMPGWADPPRIHSAG